MSRGCPAVPGRRIVHNLYFRLPASLISGGKRGLILPG